MDRVSCDLGGYLFVHSDGQRKWSLIRVYGLDTWLCIVTVGVHGCDGQPCACGRAGVTRAVGVLYGVLHAAD